MSTAVSERDSDYRSRELLEEMYWEDGMSQTEIADEFGVSQATIRYWMHELDVETRPQGKRPGTKHVADEEILEDIAAVAEEVGRPPSPMDYEFNGRFSEFLARDRFGSWTEARRLALEGGG